MGNENQDAAKSAAAKEAAEAAQIKQQLAKRDADEALIRKKIARGLTRDQAEAAVKHQEKFTAAREKQLAQRKQEAEKAKKAGK